MNDTLRYIIKKYAIDISQPSPIEVYNRSRRTLAKVLGELRCEVGVEIGTERGEHAKILCESIPNLHLYCIDPWKDYPRYSHYQGQQEENYRTALETLSPYDCVLLKDFSMDAVEQFGDNTLDFVYIDGGHDYRNVVDDICEWSRKVRVGGIVYGHDYTTRLKSRGVIQVEDAVKGYMSSHHISPWFLFSEGMDHYDRRRKKARIWLYVRQAEDFLEI